MQFKVVPPVPDELDVLFAVRDAVPLVPGTVEDCCTRVLARTDVPARDEAREWLTFLRALCLVREGDGGYHRVRARRDPSRADLARRFRERVYLVDPVLDALDATAGRDAAAVFERVAEEVPAWERQRHADWTAAWRERVARLLGWAALFGLAAAAPDGYRAAADPPV